MLSTSAPQRPAGFGRSRNLQAFERLSTVHGQMVIGQCESRWQQPGFVDARGSGIARGSSDRGDRGGSSDEVVDGPLRNDDAADVQAHGVELALVDHVADRASRDLQPLRYLGDRVDERGLSRRTFMPRSISDNPQRIRQGADQRCAASPADPISVGQSRALGREAVLAFMR